MVRTSGRAIAGVPGRVRGIRAMIEDSGTFGSGRSGGGVPSGDDPSPARRWTFAGFGPGTGTKRMVVDNLPAPLSHRRTWYSASAWALERTTDRPLVGHQHGGNAMSLNELAAAACELRDVLRRHEMSNLTIASHDHPALQLANALADLDLSARNRRFLPCDGARRPARCTPRNPPKSSQNRAKE